MTTSAQPQLALGEQLRDRGTAQVLTNNEAYQERFFKCAQSILDWAGAITSDSVVYEIGMPPGHPSAVGACMKAFAKQERLVVDHYRKSTRPSCHAAIIAVWRRK